MTETIFVPLTPEEQIEKRLNNVMRFLKLELASQSVDVAAIECAYMVAWENDEVSVTRLDGVIPPYEASTSRDFGGSVISGQPYMVGVDGQPELFVPDVSGPHADNPQPQHKKKVSKDAAEG